MITLRASRAASLLFRGGFPRGPFQSERRAAQRAIFHVQRELERLAQSRDHGAIALCDRGTLDALAYWPGDPSDFFADVCATRESELARYAAVIHRAWEGHPHRYTVESTPDFLDKVVRVLALVAAELPTGTLTADPVPGVTRDA